jgi:predicted component of type VI protein secretion system
MAYVVVYHKDQEIARRKLDGPVTIGRSSDCELSVHDILLSRRHCQIQPEGDGWIISDLGSKNGTRMGDTPVFRLPLSDGDVAHMGKTAVRFRSGNLRPSTRPASNRLRRPADPFEALAGTMVDPSFQHAAPVPLRGPIRWPYPQPSPREPEGYQSEDVRSLVSELVSSSWDSIYETARQPEAALPHPSPAHALPRKRSREPRVDLGLQVRAEPMMLELPPSVREAAVAMFPQKDQRRETRAEAPPATAIRIQARTRTPFRFLLRRLAMIFQWLALGMLIWPR